VYLQIPCSRVFVKEIIGVELVKISFAGYKTGSFMAVYSQKANTGPYPAPHLPCSHNHSLKLNFNTVFLKNKVFIKSFFLSL